ncbi:hypothetical protein VF21_06399 [Pseudogymnoascus sp. 05NY08]|nr:hypothetical protein VF21_06399 [Pseudogymnoascus sp. 05NY08]
MDHDSKMTGPTAWDTWGYNTEGRRSADTASYKPELKGEEEISQENSIALTPGTNAKLSPQYIHITAVDNNAFKSSLDKSYKTHHSKDFKRGSVFKVLWTEPQGEVKPHQWETKSASETSSHSKYGELAYTSIRRFIIVKSYEGHSTCLPILTYSNQGTAKPGVKAQHHAIIYSSKRPPSELSGEPELLNVPIRIEMASPADRLVPESRLNYAKVYTVEHNVKVHFIGRVHKDSSSTFKGDFRRIQDSFLVDDASDPSDRDDTALTEDDTTADDDVASSSGYYAYTTHKQNDYQGWGGKTYSY